MLDLKFIRAHPDLVKHAAVTKAAPVDVDRILELDGRVRASIAATETLRQERKSLSRGFSTADAAQKAELSAQSQALGDRIEAHETELESLKTELRDLLLLTPNIPDPTAPVGPDASFNVVTEISGTPPAFDFETRDHVDLVQMNGWAELAKASAISGSRTYALRGMLVRLELALMNFALDRLAAEGFTAVSAPPFAREDAFIGTGHFPAGREDVYELRGEDLFLIGTSEVFLNSLHADEILAEKDLPILYAGYSGCYRREAGSGGRDVRGLLRVHHFTKVEQFVICRDDPEESRRWHERLLAIARGILEALELPYRVVECCTGDMGLGKVRMHDIEAWVPSLGTYRETHSCSTLHDWQARRTNTRWRAPDKSIRPVHTLNNTAIATPRIFAPLLEVHQRKDGGVNVPEALRPYLGGIEVL